MGHRLIGLANVVAGIAACGGAVGERDGADAGMNGVGDGGSGTDSGGGGSGLPAAYQAVYNVESIAVDGDWIVIRTRDLPDHGSPFYAQGNPRYEPYNG